MPCIETLTEEQAGKLVSAFNRNNQLQGSYGFNGTKAWTFGDGLAVHLTRITGMKYVMEESAKRPSALQIKLKKR